MIKTHLKLATDSEVSHLLKSTKSNPKYQLVILLMLDGGMRVTEAISLMYKDLDFVGRSISVKSLKKKSVKPVYRSIPMSYRLYEAFAEYLKSGRSRDPGDYVFPGESGNAHLNRTCVYKYIKKYSQLAVSPHMLRHTCATKICKASGIRQAQKMLGHASSATTEIYLHVDDNELRGVVDRVVSRSKFERFINLFKRPVQVAITKSDVVDLEGVIGRRKELEFIDQAISKRNNLYVSGPAGIGKSHLLKALNGDKILRIDDMRQLKQTIKNLFLYLQENGKREMLSMSAGSELSDSYLSRSSVSRLVELILSVVDDKEYTLIVDDLTYVTKSSMVVLEKLKTKFHLIVAAREVKVAYTSLLSNFEKLDLDRMPKDVCMTMIYRLSKDFRDRIVDYNTYANYIMRESGGNPRSIIETVKWLSSEQIIDVTKHQKSRLLGSSNYIDFSVPVVICVAGLMVFRYIASEMEIDSGAYRMIGGASLVILLFAREFFKKTKRTYV